MKRFIARNVIAALAVAMIGVGFAGCGPKPEQAAPTTAPKAVSVGNTDLIPGSQSEKPVRRAPPP